MLCEVAAALQAMADILLVCNLRLRLNLQLNDLAAIESVAYLIKYDSVHGTFSPSVTVENDHIVISQGDRTLKIPYTHISKPAEVRVHLLISS
jgi:glyceraldehyde-3-phosphate dehydrogenase/erythrose-4-phosphate dehydrogenase